MQKTNSQDAPADSGDRSTSWQGFTRRSFIKSSAALAVGSVLSLEASAFVRGNDTIRVALIGCGGRGSGAASQALSTEGSVKLVAMADAFRDRLDASYNNLLELHGPEKVDVPEERKFVGFDAYRHAIEAADVVLLTTPPGFRPMHFEEAVRAGRHVFMEKPVATDAPGIRQILATSEEAKRKNLSVVVGLNYRYSRRHIEVAKRIHDGMIGDILSMHTVRNSSGVWVRQRKPGQTEMEYQMQNWYYFNWLCGEQIVEQFIHQLDIMNWFKGSYPVSAQGTGGREARSGPDYGDTFNHHYVAYEYADGCILHSQCRHMEGCWNKTGTYFIGTRGSVDADFVMYDRNGSILYRYEDQNDRDPYQVEHDVLFDSIRSGNPVNDVEHGAYSSMMAIMGRMATHSGQYMKWEDSLNSSVSIMPKAYTWDATPPSIPDEHGEYPLPVPGVTRVV